MNPDIAIEVAGLSKVYKLYGGPADRLKEAVNPFRRKYHTDFYALQDVSFDVRKGETLGIIGKNGSGKSTLLKMITGVSTPTAGTIQTRGSVGALLELGAEFNLDLTGLENVYFNGRMMGYSRDRMDERMDSILSFADIGEFVHQPVRLYSSGMYVRLAFAVAISIDPDILIVDEALAVGDIRFQQKCYRRIREFSDSGKTILLVTHDMGAVTSFCSRAIWLKDGRLAETGKPEDVAKKYVSYMSYDMLSTESDGPSEKGTRGGPGERKAQAESQIKWENVDSCLSFGEGERL